MTSRRADGRQFRRANPGNAFRRLASAASMLAVLLIVFLTARDPRNWKWLEPAPAARAVANAFEQPTTEFEPGPTDLTPQEKIEAAADFQKVVDRQPMSAGEMKGYWRLIGWINAQSTDQLGRRARNDLMFTHLWETPEKYRGELIALDINVRRAITYEVDAREGAPAQLKRLFELSGPTIESKSNPYILVGNRCPPGFPIGAEVDERVRFYGYFFKLLAYRGGDDRWRAAPLLIGRWEWLSSAGRTDPAPDFGPSSVPRWIAAICLAYLALRWVVLPRCVGKRNSPSANPADSQLEQWLRSAEAIEGETKDPRPENH